MRKFGLALGVAGALALTVFLVLGLLGDRGGGGEAVDPDDAVREAKDEGAHLQGTGAAGELVVARTGDLRITGAVRDGDGKPLADCRVGIRLSAQQGVDPRDPSTWAKPAPGGWGVGTRADDDMIDQPGVRAFTPELEVTTGVEGRFDVAVNRLGHYDVRALVEAPLVSSQATAYLYLQRTTANVDLTVVEGAPLVGRVGDANDKPVAAVVSGYVAGTRRTGWTADPIATDPSDGSFGWPALPAGKGNFRVTLPGRLLLRGQEVELPHEGVWTLRLDAESGAVIGRLVDGEDAPIAGARVLVDTGKSLARATSDAEGAYRADGLLAGEVQRVVVEADGYGQQAQLPPLARWSGAVVKAGETITINVTLHAGATVEGVVRETGSGRTLAGVEVFVLQRAADQRQRPVPNTITDAAGRYVLAGIPPGLHVILARSATHHLQHLQAQQLRSFVMTSQGIPIAPGPPPELTLLVSGSDVALTKHLELVQGLTLAGRVVDAEGAPVAGAEVQTDQAALAQAAWRWGVSWPGWGVPLATTGEDGRFVATGLVPNPALPLRASKKPLASAEPVTVRLSRDEPIEEVVIALAPCVTIEGRVLGPDDQGVEAWVHAWSTLRGNAGYANVTTDPDGTFRLDGLPAGGARLTARSQDYGSADTTLETIPAGETKTGVEIRLRAGVRVSGTLVDQHGNPVPNRRITLTRSGANVQITVKVDEDGYFETDHAPKGRLKPTVTEMQGSTGVPVSVGKVFDSPADGLRLTVRVPERTIVEGTIVDPDGQPVPICRVTISPLVNGRVIRSPNRGFSFGDADEVVNGEFRREVKGEPPFQFEVSAPRARDGTTLNLRGNVVEVTDPAAGPVQIRLEQGVELVGQVLDPEGQGVAHVVVKAFTVLATTDGDGVFRLGGLGGGPVNLDITPPPGWVKPAAPNVAPDEEVEIVLRPAAAIAGTVRDGAGNLTAGYARIEASWPASGDVQAGKLYGTAHSGVFRLDGIPRGVDVHLIVTLYGQSGSTAPVALDVEAGDEAIEVVVGGGPVVAGFVLDEDGRPLAGASLSVVPLDAKGARTVWSQTTGEGRFHVSGVEAGRYRILVRRPGENAQAEMLVVTAPNEDVRITLVAPRTIRGRLLGMSPGGKHRIRAWIQGVPDANVGDRARVADDGTFELNGLGSGAVVLAVQSGNQFALSGPIEPGATGVELKLQEGERITGTVVDADGEVPGYAWIVAKSDRWHGSAWTQDGAFEIQGLPPGRYRLVARGQTPNVDAAEVEAHTGSTNVQLRVP